LRRHGTRLEAIEPVDDEVVQEELGAKADLEGSHRPIRRGRDGRCGGGPRAQEGPTRGQEIAAVRHHRSTSRGENGPRTPASSTPPGRSRRPAWVTGEGAPPGAPGTMLSEPAADSTAPSPFPGG